jgi:hypothetical protein
MRQAVICALCVLGLVIQIEANGQVVGTLTGVVLDADRLIPAVGLPVVIVEDVAKNRKSSPPSVFRSTTDEKGAFALPWVPGGNYNLCIGGKSEYLDPCQWAGDHGSITVSGSVQVLLPLMVQRGVKLVVRLMARGDSNSLFKGIAESGVANLDVRDTQGVRRVLTLERMSERVAEYSVLLPPNSKFIMTATSALTSFYDAAGQDVTAQLVLGKAIYLPGLRDNSSLKMRLPFALLDVDQEVLAYEVRLPQ